MATNDWAMEIGRFASEHPEGWGHEEWLGLIHSLSEAGHDTSDGDAIGLALERERLSQTLGRMEVKGLGAKRIDSLVGHFGTLWNLKSASPEDLAQVRGVSVSLAEQILKDLQ